MRSDRAQSTEATGIGGHPYTRSGWRVKALAHLEMTRPYTLFHSGLLAIAGAEVASQGTAAGWRVALAALVTICGWEAGLYAGDYYDRRIDALSKPYRAIPSGRVSAREAFLTMVALIAIGYLSALLLGLPNLALAVLTTALGIAYSKAFKNKALLGNFDRGILGICAVAFGALAGGSLAQWPVVLLAALAFFHDSATNLVGAIRDVEGDRAAGCHTAPAVYGLRAATLIAATLGVLWALCGIGLLALTRPGWLALLLVALALAQAAYVYGALALQAVGVYSIGEHTGVTRAQALQAHKLLVIERLTLLCGIIAIYASVWVALGLLAFTLAATLLAQTTLRDRYDRVEVAESGSRA
ncbi:MAG: UbiA family prenyltransferase [Ktedonobacterales bacterium]